MKHRSLALFSFFFFSVLFVGCNKSDRDEDTTLVSAAEAAQAQTVVFNVLKEVHQSAVFDQFFTDTTYLGQVNEDCQRNYAVRTTAGTFPLTMTTEFVQGTSCTANAIQSGRLQASFNGNYNRMLNRITITCDSLKVLDHTISGSFNYRIIQIGDTFKFEYNSDNLNIFNDTASFFLSNKLTISWVEGVQTEQAFDDVFLISGRFSGLSHEGNTYEAQVREPLRNAFACKYFEGGKFQLNAATLEPRFISFQSGCVNMYQVEIAGREEEKMLP